MGEELEIGYQRLNAPTEEGQAPAGEVTIPPAARSKLPSDFATVESSSLASAVGLDSLLPISPGWCQLGSGRTHVSTASLGPLLHGPPSQKLKREADYLLSMGVSSNVTTSPDPVSEDGEYPLVSTKKRVCSEQSRKK